MSEDFKLLAKLAADTTQFDASMKSAAQKTRLFQQTAKDIFQATRSPTDRYALALDRVRGAYARGMIDMKLYQAATKQLSDEFFVASGAAAKLTVSIKGINAGASLLPSRLANVQAGFSKIGAAASGALRGVHGVGIAITGMVGIGIGKHAFNLAADFDATSASMEVLLKDTTKAKRLMEDLYQFAARTPFEFPEVAAAGKQLVSIGDSTEQVGKDLKMLGDIALGVDAPLSEIVDIFRRNSTQAHIFSRDIQEFAGRGIPIIKVLAERFKVTDGELMKLVEDGKVGFKDVRKALEDMTAEGGQFNGMTDKLGKRMKGIASTAKDDLNTAMRELGNILGETVLPYLAQAAKDVANMAKELRDFNSSDVGKAVSAQSERQAKQNPYANPRSIAEQIKANEEETRKLLKLSAEISAQAENRGEMPFFSRIGSFFNMRDITLIQEQLNNLARERAGLQKAFAQQYDPGTKELAGDIKEVTSEISGGLSSALAKGQAGLSDLIAATGKGQEKMKGLFRDMREMAKAGAEDAARARSIIEATRTPEEKYTNEIKELDALRKKGALNEDTYGRAVAAAAERLQASDGTKAMFDEIKSLRESLRTPYEQFQDELKHLDELKAKGLEEETYLRAKAKAENDFIASGPKQTTPEYTSENRALLRGSAEAFSAMNRANDKKTLEKIAEDQLSTLKRSELLQRQQLNAQQNVALWGNN